MRERNPAARAGGAMLAILVASLGGAALAQMRSSLLVEVVGLAHVALK